MPRRKREPTLLEKLREDMRAQMERSGLLKTEVHERMGTSMAQLNRVLDPASNLSLEQLIRFADAVGCGLKVELTSDA